jgi:GH35 family endo-1,4-beta-xylanase
MTTNRRNFLRSTALGLSGVALTNPFDVRATAINLPFFMSGANHGTMTNTSDSIRKIRMREVEIQLFDHFGNPLKNRSVEILLTKHAFLFGDCNPEMDSLFRQGSSAAEKLDVYRKVFAGTLNAVNSTCYWTERPRNNMAKTEAFQGEYKLDGFADTVDWGNANGLTVKGHPLFWTVPKAVPDWMSKYDYPTQLKFLEVRLRSMVSRFKGKVKLWDAINEMLWEPALKNLADRNWPHLESLDNMAEYISFVLRICREEDPDAKFLLNDYGLEKNHNAKAQLAANDNDPNAAKESGIPAKDGTIVTARLQRKRYLELVKRLREIGFPPSAIGLQGHSGAVTPAEQMAFYDEMSQAGLPLHITEFWANPGDFDDTFQKLPAKEQDLKIADYVKQFLTNAFAHPAIESFFFWGFMGMATTWPQNNAPVYEEKPVLQTVKDLIHKEWNTHEILNTDSNGILKFRGYYGDYSLRYGLPGSDKKNFGIPFKIGKFEGMPFRFETIG